jgi:hypothetical protein
VEAAQASATTEDATVEDSQPAAEESSDEAEEEA